MSIVARWLLSGKYLIGQIYIVIQVCIHNHYYYAHYYQHIYTLVGDLDSLNMSPSAPHWLKEVEKEDKKMLTGETICYLLCTRNSGVHVHVALEYMYM